MKNTNSWIFGMKPKDAIKLDIVRARQDISEGYHTTLRWFIQISVLTWRITRRSKGRTTELI